MLDVCLGVTLFALYGTLRASVVTKSHFLLVFLALIAEATSSELAAGGSSTAGALASSDAAGGDGLPALPDMGVASLLPWLLDSDDEGMMLEHVSLHDQIKERATEVRQDRDWTTLLELLAFASLRKHRVHVCFGAQVVDLVQLFAPWLAASIDNSTTPIRLLGCQIV